MKHPEKQVPFGYAQGRLSTPLKCAALRMTGCLGSGAESLRHLERLHRNRIGRAAGGEDGEERTRGDADYGYVG
jgi:hypothetical protein